MTSMSSLRSSISPHLSSRTIYQPSSAYDVNSSSFSSRRLEARERRKMMYARPRLVEDLSRYRCYVYIMRSDVEYYFGCLAVLVAFGAAYFLHELIMYINKENHQSYAS